MIVNNPDNAGLTPGPGILLVILSNNFSTLTTVSFATERLVGAGSELDGTGFGVWAATEVTTLYAMSEAVSVAERSARACFARDGVGSGVGVLESCCCTRLGFDCDPWDLCFPDFLNIEENLEDTYLRMMVQNRFELGMNTRLRLSLYQ